jgi:hypothetical protein
MDISNYTWVDTFEVKNSTQPTLSPTSTKDNNNINNTSKIVIGVLSGIVGISILGIIGLIVHLLRKKRRRDILNIPGSS